MELVYFIYGLAFFLMGFAILLYPKKGSSLEMSANIRLIAWFGILHGINEWLDLFIYIEFFGNPMPLQIIRLSTLPVSFIFLAVFASKVLSSCKSKPKLCRFFPLNLGLLWFVFFLVSSFGVLKDRNWHQAMIMWDIWSRYILCVPGAFLTGMALLFYVPQVEPARLKKITLNLKIAGFTFMVYAFLAGAIVKQADFFPASFLNYDSFKQIFAGIPVQIFRAACAVVMAYSFVRVLEIFHWEIKRDLHESQLRFSTVANQTPVILFTTDKTKKITFIEGKMLDALNLSPQKLIGSKITDIFDNDAAVKSVESALAGKNPTSTYTSSNCILQVSYGPLMDRGRIDGVIGVAVDITAQQKAKVELDDYRQRMLEQKTLAEIGTLSTEMVQKLSTPIASIKASLLTALVTLRKMPDNNNLRQPLQNSLEQSTKAMEMIDKFFNFANITPNPKAEPIDIEQIINRVLAVFRDRINQMMLKVETSGIDIVPLMFISSREVEQIVFSILQNVVQSSDGKEVGFLSIHFDLVKDNLKMFFSGSFKGFEYEDPNDLFEPFTSSDSASSGSTFGLVVLKRLVLAYNGSIEARRENNRTTIEIILPVQNL